MEAFRREIDRAGAMAFGVCAAASAVTIAIGVPALAPVSFLIVSVILYIKSR